VVIACVKAHAEGSKKDASPVIPTKKFLARVVVHHFRETEFMGWYERVLTPNSGNLF
jgi:hypothetical protein